MKETRNIAAILLIVVLLLSLAGCSAGPPNEQGADNKTGNQYFEIPSSRNESINIPVAVTVPEQATEEECPVVVIVHGFLGSKDENGIYYGKADKTGIDSIAEQLLRLGIGTIRIDQPACGESKDDLRNYTLENNVADLNEAYNYCLEKYGFDNKRVGLVGHSMGGKVGVQFAAEHPEIQTMVLLNPAGDNGNTSLLTAAQAGLDYKTLEKEALDNGEEVLNKPLSQYAGRNLYMSADFFRQVNESRTGDELKSFISKGKQGLLIYGDKDKIINPKTYSWIIANTGIEYICIPGMAHELGLDTNDLDVTNIVTDMAASYLYRFLTE